MDNSFTPQRHRVTTEAQRKFRQILSVSLWNFCVLCGVIFGFSIWCGAQEEATMAWQLSSPAFRDGERIPTQHTCDGADLSPPLSWTTPPTGTKALALTVDDPDAPTGNWVHWVVYNLPSTTQGLSANVPKEPTLPDGALQGLNDFGRVGYGGPCPPPGTPHHYLFTLYALDGQISLPPRATKAQLEQRMKGHVLSHTRLTGLYQR